MQSSSLSDRIRAKMNAHSLTISALSERAGISESTLGRILNNRVGSVQPATVRLLADALGCSPSDLTGHEEEKPTADFSAAVDAIVDVYEARLYDLERHYKDRADDLKTIYDERIKRSRLLMYIFMVLALLFIVAFVLLAARVIWDLSQPNAGVVRYKDVEELLKRLGIGTLNLESVMKLFTLRG